MFKASQTGNDSASHQAGHSSPSFQPTAPAPRAGTFHKEAFQSPPVSRMHHFSAGDCEGDVDTGLASALAGANDSLDLIRDDSQALQGDLGDQSFHYPDAEIDVFNTTFYGYENSGLGADDLQADDLSLNAFHLPRDLQIGASPHTGPATSPQRWTLPYELTVGDSHSPEFSFHAPFAALTLDEAPLDTGPAQRTGGIEEAPTL